MKIKGLRFVAPCLLAAFLGICAVASASGADKKNDQREDQYVLTLLKQARYREAIEFYEKRGISPESLYDFTIGILILNGNDSGKLDNRGQYSNARGLALVRKAAFMGLEQAALELGNYYQFGMRGYPKNDEKARFWRWVADQPKLGTNVIAREAARHGETLTGNP